MGQIVNILLVAIIAMVPIVSLRSFGVAAKIYLFDLTPPQFLVFTFLLLFMYATQYGLMPIIRMQQLIFTTSHFVFLLIILLGLLAINAKHYQPILAGGVVPILKGAIPSWYAYTGPEMVIGLLYPFVTRQQQVFKWSAACVAALVTVYTLITAIVQGILGPKEAAHMLVPTVIAYRSVEIPDTFIERLDGYFIIFWIPVFTSCMMVWVYLAAFGIERILKLEYSRPVVVLLVPLLSYLTSMPPDYQTAAAISQWVNYAFIAWGLGLWPLLLGIAWWKQKRGSAC